MAVRVTRTEFTAADLHAASARCMDGAQVRRILALALVLEGRLRTDAAVLNGMDRQTLSAWVHRYNADGLDGLKSRKSPGREPFPTAAQKTEFRELVIHRRLIPERVCWGLSSSATAMGANRGGMDGPAFRRHVAQTGMEETMASGDIASTLRRADGGVTILDDKVDVENDAIFVWLKGHSILRGDMRHYALVTEPGLPQPWQATAVQFTDVAQATTFLQGLHAEAKTKPILEKAVAWLPPPPTPAPSPATIQVGLSPPPSKHGVHHRPAAKPKVTMADLIARIAPELVSRRFSLIPVTRLDSRFIGKTDPAVYGRVNGACGTAIQFDELSKFEGGQWLRGYVPMRHGLTVDSSGMTIATGFDIGQWYAHELTTKLGLEGALKFKLNLFTAPEHRGHLVPPIKPGMNTAAVFPTGNFARMSKQAVAKKVAETAPVPMLDKAEADKVDEAVHTFVTNQAKDAWNEAAKPGIPRFEQLPSGWQTAVMSRFFQQGPGFATREPGASFFEAATAGDWARATALFRGMSSSSAMAKYADRLAAETRLLSAAMPPPVKPSGPPAAPGVQPVRR